MDYDEQPTRFLAEDLNMAKLSAEQITEKLKAIPGWEYKNNAISKMFKFKEFLLGIEFVQKVAEIAEAADHHPDITINYTRVTFSCSTHDAGGVTDKDFKLADNIEIAFKDRDA
jgi:4a-hydroxytetrahydrobiopterin dehydratase